MKRRLRILTAGFAAAVLLVLYPFFADLYNSRIQEQRASSNTEAADNLPDEELEEELEKAALWNEILSGASMEISCFEGMTEEEIYESCLNLNGDGVMGSVEIPKISVSLPIYHYATEDVLKEGIGHMESTALPVGGEGTRCVLTGHRGLPGSRLFTYLDEVEVGDYFFLHVLGETLAYEVVEIEVVEPEDVESITAESGRDLCTLVTCTPYGVNTHRLLVTGERTEYSEEIYEEAGEDSQKFFWRDYLLLYIAAGELVLLFWMRKRIRKNWEE